MTEQFPVLNYRFHLSTPDHSIDWLVFGLEPKNQDEQLDDLILAAEKLLTSLKMRKTSL